MNHLHSKLLLTLPLALLAACTSLAAPPAEVAATKASHLIGTLAPPFTLPDVDEHPVSLADFKGRWVVVYFFPKEDTPGCPCGTTDFTTLLYELKDVAVPVLAISDSTIEDAAYHRDQYNIQAIQLADPDGLVLIPWGARSNQDQSLTRATYLIDPQGRIAWHWPVVVAQGHVNRINAKIKELGG